MVPNDNAKFYTFHTWRLAMIGIPMKVWLSWRIGGEEHPYTSLWAGCSLRAFHSLTNSSHSPEKSVRRL